MKELIQIVPLIVAASTLREVLRGDVLAAVEAEFEGVLAFYPADVVRELVKVLDGGLRSITVGTDIEAVLVVEGEIGE